jgi:sec-independent protein translocase protein TatB
MGCEKSHWIILCGSAKLPGQPWRFVCAARGQVSWVFMATPQIIELGILGWSDSLILMIMALVVFGPRRLPEIGRQIGKLMYEFRKASSDFKFQMEEELRLAEDADRRKKQEEQRLALAAAAPAVDAAALPSQVSESGSGAPSSEVTAAAETSVEETPALPLIEENKIQGEIRIQPPSTGEQVPAARPGSVAAQAAAELAEQDEALKAAPADSKLAEPIATEHTNQHG